MAGCIRKLKPEVAQAVELVKQGLNIDQAINEIKSSTGLKITYQQVYTACWNRKIKPPRRPSRFAESYQRVVQLVQEGVPANKTIYYLEEEGLPVPEITSIYKAIKQAGMQPTKPKQSMTILTELNELLADVKDELDVDRVKRYVKKELETLKGYRYGDTWQPTQRVPAQTQSI